mgnify:CR=1 FL=1
MTQHFPQRQLRFFMTGVSPCPYLPGKTERKVFANLPFAGGPAVNDRLTQAGFRRSQNIAYRPACDDCAACVSVRVPVEEVVFSKSQKRTLARNADLTRTAVEPAATVEQYRLLSRYLHTRHPEGGMAGMGWLDYVAMVEDTSVRTHLIEYRLPSTVADAPGRLVGVALTDRLSDGLSMVYSFYDPDLAERSPGVFAILDHILQAREAALPYLYLGYWVRGSAKMDYKARFRPLEALTFLGWTRIMDEAPGA